MRLMLTGCFLLGLTLAARSQPTSCDTLMHSHIPFQVTLKGEKGEEIVSQVYRSDNLYKIIYTKLKDKVVKSLYQANFAKTMPTNLGDIKSSYSVPTDKFWYDQNITSVHVTSELHGNKVEKDDKYTMIGDEDVPAGSCVFRTKHYAIEIISKDRTVHSEVWLSPELTIQLKFKSDLDKSLNVVDISTDFIPFH